MPEKFLQHDASGGFREVVASAIGGIAQANTIPELDASGRLDATMMPTGIGAETSVVPASGALAAGDFVNVFNDAGTMKARKADATSATAPANGFVLEAFADTANATVYWGGINNALAGMTVGQQFLSTTAGAPTATAPSASGNIVQKLGLAVSATVMNFNPQDPILLA